MCCSVLQCVAVCCSVLQCVAVCCSMLKHVGLCCSVFVLFVRDLIRTLQHTATRSNTHSRKSSHKESKHNSTNFNTLQLTATHCITIQHAGARVCNTVQHTAILQRAATRCNALARARTPNRLYVWIPVYTLQHTTTHHTTLQPTATHRNTLQHSAPHRNALQHAATHCIMLQHTDIMHAYVLPNVRQ